MENFKLYSIGKDGVKWYRCTNCGYLTRGMPHECPVCQGRPIKKQEGDDNDSPESK